MRTLIRKFLLYIERKRKAREQILKILKHTFITIETKKNTSITLSCLGVGRNERATKTLTWKNIIVFNETKQATVEKFLKKVYKEMTQKRRSLDEVMDAKITGFGDDINKVLNKFKLSVKTNKKTVDLLDETGVVIFRGLRENVKKYTNFISKSNRERKALIKAMYKRASSHPNKYNPKNAIAKGYNDIPVSRNGTSADFDGLTKYLYKGDSAFGKVKIKVTGSRDKDFKQAFEKMGILDPKLQKKIKRKYTWHHVDDLDEGLECTIQLVTKKAHKATYKHLGSAYQFQDLLDILKYLT
jgi:hypothetical protein